MLSRRLSEVKGICLGRKLNCNRGISVDAAVILTRNRISAAIAALALIGGAFLFVIQRRRPAQPPESDAAYVAPATCAGCHDRIARSYRLTGMGRSLYRPRPAENAVEDFKSRNKIYNRASDRY